MRRIIFSFLIFMTGGLYGQLANTPWPMFRQNLKHTGWTNDNVLGVQKNPVAKWSYTTGSYVESSPAVGSDGTIYVGSYDHKLYAIKPDGTLKWSYTTEGVVYSSPVIGSDDTIYVGSHDHKLYAIKPDGTLKWSYTTGDGVNSSPAIGSDGTVYVGSCDHKLYAINSNGTLKWSYLTGAVVYSSPVIGSDGTIYVGSYDGKLYAINPDGSLKWSYKTGSVVYSSPVIGIDGTIYVGSCDRRLYAITNGSLKWSYTTGDYVYSSPAIGSDGTIYVGSEDNKLYAINPDGSLKWSYTTGGAVKSSPAIGSDGTIYVGSYDGKLYAINPDGSLKWSYTTGDSVDFSSPAIGSDGTIYVGSYDGKLYAIKQNNEPELQWSGNAGYVSDGVNPDKSVTGSIFRFEVKYKDIDNDEPLIKQVWIDTNDNGSYEAGEKFSMYSNSGTSYSNGIIYTNSIQIFYAGDGVLNYRFYFTDGINEATGNAVQKHTIIILKRVSDNLENVIAGPVPFSLSKGGSFRFEGLTANAVVKIYTILGELVTTLTESDGDGELEWDLKNSENKYIAEGVYICEITNNKGERKFIKVAIVK